MRVRVRERRLELVLAHDQRQAALAVDAPQDVHDAAGERGIEARRGLVGQDHRRRLGQRARDRHALLLAARERVGAAVGERARGPTCARHSQRERAVGRREAPDQARPAAARSRAGRPARCRAPSARRTRLNCWKIMPICRRTSRSARGSAPGHRPGRPTRTVPAVGSTSRLIARRNVVLPAPLRPMITTNSPRLDAEIDPVEGHRAGRQHHPQPAHLDHAGSAGRLADAAGRARSVDARQRGREPSRSIGRADRIVLPVVGGLEPVDVVERA